MNKMKLNIQIFASGTISGTSTSSGGACRIVWSSTKNNTNNTSSVTATVQARRTTAGSTYCTLAGTVTIDGTAKSISKYRPSSDPWNSDWKDVGSFTKVVTHNSDGSKQINISCNVNGDAGSMEGNFKASATVTLDKINRTSLLGEIDDFNIDDTVSISITKYITTATDTLVIKAGDTTIKTISGVSDGYNLTFTTAEKNVIKEKMTSPRIILTFTLTSIDGATTLGTSIKSAICIFLDMPTIFRIKKNANGNYRLAINGPCDVNGGALQIYGDDGRSMYGIGSIFITGTNESPASYLGGTWELFDKEFISTQSALGGFNRDTANVTSSTVYWSRSGHAINCELGVTNKVALTDATIVLGTFDKDLFGISRFNHTERITGYSDGGNAVVEIATNTAGTVTSIDVIGKTSSAQVGIGEVIYMSFTQTIHFENMLDEACDKFYWKRVN